MSYERASQSVVNINLTKWVHHADLTAYMCYGIHLVCIKLEYIFIYSLYRNCL